MEQIVKDRETLMAEISANIASATPEQQRELNLFLSGWLEALKQMKRQTA